MNWGAWVAEQHDAIHASGRWRAPRDFDGTGPAGALAGEPGEVVSFASNDYLGLTRHPAVVAAARDALDRWGTGSGSARLIVGSRPVHTELEAELAAWKGAAAATLFTTGYAANLGVLTALGGPDVLVVSDELNHASLIDGCRLSRSRVEIFRHRDVDHAAALLTGWPGRAMVVTDSVFSMDGDVAPVAELVALCERTGTLLVLDEAHAVLGPDVEPGGASVLRVGTLSKTLGALGGFVAGPRAFCELLVNRARSYIFTTALSPADSAAALAAVRVLRSADGAGLLDRLRRHVDVVAPGHPSPIVPIVLGDEGRALDATRALLDRGLLVPAIRPPTVPPGTSRLRVALSAAHTDGQVASLAGALADLGLLATAGA